MSLGLSTEKFLLIGLLAVFLLGPERLPGLAAHLARIVSGLRQFANDAKGRLKEEMGSDYDDVDWTKLDPRRYDPRRIIREALIDAESPPVASSRLVLDRADTDSAAAPTTPKSGTPDPRVEPSQVKGE